MLSSIDFTLDYYSTVDTTLRRTLHERGLRMTPQRQLVLDAVIELGHGTPEQVCVRVQCFAPVVNITTIYRTLDLLEELGVIHHTHLGHGAPRYSTMRHEYIHLVCHCCGVIAEVPSSTLNGASEMIREHFGFELDATHLALSDRCAKCRRQTSDGADVKLAAAGAARCGSTAGSAPVGV